MTVATTLIVSGPYTGNGATSQFSYGFRVENKNQLIVYETDNSVVPGVVTVLTVDTHYTVNNVGTDGGGTIDRIAGNLPTGDKWYIRSNYSDNQDTAFASQGGFLPAVHEAAIDKLTFLHQQQVDRIARAMKLSDDYFGSVDPTLPTPEAGKTLRWNAGSTALENADGAIGSWTGNWAGPGTDYFQGDIMKDAAGALGLNNLYIANGTHTSTSSLVTDTSNWDLLVNVADVETAKVAAETAQTAAELAETNAETAETNVAADWLSFDTRYLGSKSSAPTLDNDGNALIDGAMYWHSTSNDLWVYDLGTTTWVVIPATTIAAMTDTVITAVASGELLKWNGTDWINQTLAEAGIQAADADTAKTDVQNDWTVQQVTPPVALSPTATIAWDLDTAPNATVALDGTTTAMGTPTNIRAGNVVNISMEQDVTGSRVITWPAAFEFGDGDATLTETASEFDVLSFLTVSTSKLRFLGIVKGFAN